MTFIVSQSKGVWKAINLLQDCVSSSPLKSSLLESSSSVFDNVCLLCFIRLFWNQTLTFDNTIMVNVTFRFLYRRIHKWRKFFLRKHENSKKRFIMISDVIYECSVFNLSCLPVARSNLSWRQSRSVVVDTNICWSETPSPARAVGCSCRPFVDDAADHSQSQTHLENVEEGKMN